MCVCVCVCVCVCAYIDSRGLHELGPELCDSFCLLLHLILCFLHLLSSFLQERERDNLVSERKEENK